jgi:hypothetical protein
MAEGRPEEPVESAQGRAGPFPFEDRDLLSQSENFKGDIAAIPKENTHGGDESGDEYEHGTYGFNTLNAGPAG